MTVFRNRALPQSTQSYNHRVDNNENCWQITLFFSTKKFYSLSNNPLMVVDVSEKCVVLWNWERRLGSPKENQLSDELNIQLLWCMGAASQLPSRVHSEKYTSFYRLRDLGQRTKSKKSFTKKMFSLKGTFPFLLVGIEKWNTCMYCRLRGIT